MIAQDYRSGFETTIHFDNENNFNYIGAAAVSATEAILGRTAIIDLKLGDSSNLYDTTDTHFVYSLSDTSKLCKLFWGIALLCCFYYLRKFRHAVRSEKPMRRSVLGEAFRSLLAKQARNEAME